MKKIEKLGTELVLAIDKFIEYMYYVARLILGLGLILYILGVVSQTKMLELYGLSGMIGSALFMIPSLIWDIYYNTKQAHYHLERLDYMMFHRVYDKDDE